MFIWAFGCIKLFSVVVVVVYLEDPVVTIFARL